MNRISFADQRLIWRKRRERAMDMHRQNYSLGEIAKELNCSRQRVHQIIVKMRGKRR